MVSINVFPQGDPQYFSYEYELGKYHIMQYRANIRIEPTRNSYVIAILGFHDEIEILENSGIAERINGVSSFWYKIKYGNLIGYTFGGNIAYETFITDFDNNGINDYFYFRYSNIAYSRIYPDRNDIMIYINNQIIDATILKTIKSPKNDGAFIKCKFTVREGYVLIVLEDYPGDHGSTNYYNYKVASDGIIEYLGES
jgi:hypothetical protein